MPVSKKILTLLALLPAMVALAVFDPIGLGNRSETHLSLVPEAKKNIEGPIVFSGILPSNAQQPGLVEFSSKFAAAKLQTEGQAKTCSHTNCSVAENLHVNQKYAEARLLLMKKTSDAVAQTVDFELSDWELLRSVLHAQERFADYSAALQAIPDFVSFKETLLVEHLGYLHQNRHASEVEGFFLGALAPYSKNNILVEAYANVLSSQGRTFEARSLLQHLYGLDPTEEILKKLQDLERN